MIQSRDQKKMLIYWKCCVFKHCIKAQKHSLHPFDHLALELSSMYAKASCDAPPPLTHNIYKQKLSVFLSPLIFILSCCNIKIAPMLWSSFYIVLTVVLLLVCLKVNYSDLSPLVVLTAFMFLHSLVHYIVKKQLVSKKQLCNSAKLK